ncbi:MAG TPA: ABC transporter ATP-binding protein [Gemmatimonadaceae bacterium]|jgi:ABC-2 type transport system ATP-binding protein
MTPGSALAIETIGLNKQFGRHVAVRDLSLRVLRGEIFGFLGPNGAGKSTSIKMLLGLVHPSGGSALVLGNPAGDVATRRAIGFLPEDFRFYEWLTATELLRFHGSLCGMSADRLRARVPEVIELVGLAPHAQRRVRGFSKGMLQRLGLAQAIVHEPDLIFLDEPTSGLDPMGRRLVRDILRAERERGATVFLNSHLLSEIEVTCDRVVFIKEGVVVAERDLRAEPDGSIRVAIDTANVGEGALPPLAAWGTDIILSDRHLAISVRERGDIAHIVRHLAGAGVDILGVRAEHTSLEDLFVGLVGEDRGL